MDIAQAYQRVDAEPAHYVLGVRMEPYSAGHERLLSALDNSFISNPEACDYGDFVSGAFVCSQPWREARRSIHSPLRQLALRFWGWRARKLYPPEEMLAFREYLNAAREDCFGGFVLTHEADRLNSPVPGLHSMRIVLAKEINLTEAEFWDRPLLLSRADYWTAMEIKNAIQPMSQAMREAFAAARN